MMPNASLIMRYVLPTVLASALAVPSVSFLGAGDSEPIHPFILFGVDGADWDVIEWMWEQSRLPNLKRLADKPIYFPADHAD